ncbi:MAG: hypothetical protein H7A19_08905 [Rhodanobacteraceae bacterium]|nr:hypothetical protein [Rhodanobacteraceae bacterium]
MMHSCLWQWPCVAVLALIGGVADASGSNDTRMLDEQGHRATRPSSATTADTPPRAALATGSWRGLGPNGGDVADVAASPVAPGVVLAGLSPASGPGALYRSTDDGANWTRLAYPAGVGVNDIEFAVDGTAYIGTNGGLLRSFDHGQHWSLIDLGIGVNQVVLDVTLVPTVPQTIWLALANPNGNQPIVLLRSTNAGGSWSNRTPALTAPLYASGIAVDPANPNTVMATFKGEFFGGAVWVSTDGGEQWADRSAGLPNSPINTVVHDGSRFLVGGGRLFGSQFVGLYATTNLGLQWTPVHDGSWPELAAESIAIDPSNPAVILVATSSHGVNRSINGGQSWQTEIGSTAGLFTRAVRFAPGSSTHVLLGASSTGVLRSLNAGASFVISSAGMSELNMTAIQSNPLNPEEIAASFSGENNGGVYTSIDGGANWILEPLPPTRYEAVGFAPDGRLYAASTGPTSVATEGLYRREGNGIWTPLGPDQGPFFETNILAIAFDPDNPQAILIGGADSGNVQGYEATIWRSEDAGASWSKRFEAQSGDTVRGLQMRSGGTAVAVVDGYTDPQQGGALRSTNSGLDWLPALQGLPGFARLGRVCLRADNQFMLAVWTSFLASARVYRSADGASWDATGWTGPVTTGIACDPIDTNRLYLSLQDAPWVLRSDDKGESFAPFGAGLVGINRTRDLSIAGTRLLLATTNGAFDTDLDRLHVDGFENP